MTTLQIGQIDDTDRERTDLGDIESLAESINRLGRGINRPLQPLVVRRGDNMLVTGGRRLSALRLLGVQALLEGTHFLFQDALEDHELKAMELEENVRRKQMSWKEEVHAIAKIHLLKTRQAVLNGEDWGTRETGELLGISKFPVSYSALISKILKNEPGSAVANATSFREAIDLCVAERARITTKEEAARLKVKQQSNVQASVLPGQEETKPGTGFTITTNEKSPNRVVIPLSRQLLLGDCLDILQTFPESSMDHCICDPPYAIEMDNIQQENMGTNVSATAKEHDVTENLQLFENMFPVIHRVLKPTSYFIMWYDLDHHEKLRQLAIKNGFKVQRWPIVWCKNSSCQNGAANVNFTKKTEVAMVMRREHALISNTKSSTTNYIEDSNVIDKATLGHPFVKPYSVWRMLLEATTSKGQTVLDPFAGVGSCPTSCVLLERVPVAIEKNENHYNRMLLNVKQTYEKQFGTEKEFLFT